jgi:tRNA nucleotidyltransferase (CCA-adding enzyme)
VDAAGPYAPDAPLLALSLAEVPALRRYFEELRYVHLEITGEDLAELGLEESPEMGRVLGDLLRRKLNGELDGRESELEAARQLIGAA